MYKFQNIFTLCPVIVGIIANCYKIIFFKEWPSLFRCQTTIVIQKTDDVDRNMNTIKYAEAKQEESCETNQNAFETECETITFGIRSCKIGRKLQYITVPTVLDVMRGMNNTVVWSGQVWQVRATRTCTAL